MNLHFHLAPHNAETKAQAIKYWEERVEKHSKPGGCLGCLKEAEEELELWNSLEIENEDTTS